MVHLFYFGVSWVTHYWRWWLRVHTRELLFYVHAWGRQMEDLSDVAGSVVLIGRRRGSQPECGSM